MNDRTCVLCYVIPTFSRQIYGIDCRYLDVILTPVGTAMPGAVFVFSHRLLKLSSCSLRFSHAQSSGLELLYVWMTRRKSDNEQLGSH